MASNIVNQSPFLATSRQFPQEPDLLTIEIDKAYIDIANIVNARTIGLFPSTRPAITGESYFVFQNKKQQTLRQVYTFTSTAAIPHGIKFFKDISYFTNNFGQYTDGTNWYGLIPGTSVAIAGQISFYVDPVNINFLVGAGAPALTKGLIVLTWMVNP